MNTIIILLVGGAVGVLVGRVWDHIFKTGKHDTSSQEDPS